MEQLDTYDESKNFIGSYPRDYVHQHALWHNTVHCWLYDSLGNVYFQIRKDEGTFYTTASGHVLAGETIKEAFAREIKEEIGVNIEHDDATLVNVVTFIMDKVKKDGTLFRDRAFANVYVYEFHGGVEDFNFDLNEISGVVKVNAEDTLKLFEKESGTISATIITSENGKNIEIKKEVDFNDFLVNKGETAVGKYGEVLNKVIELTKVLV
jgi:8-oxo-dGTP pyrophosphatase MutT (NUDIX family)